MSFTITSPYERGDAAILQDSLISRTLCGVQVVIVFEKRTVKDRTERGRINFMHRQEKG